MKTKMITTICLFLLCSGCFDPDSLIKAEIGEVAKNLESVVKAEVKAEVKTQIETTIDTKIDNDMNAKMNILGGDIEQKLADQLNAKFDTQIETHTQNQGMFSGGAIYVVIVAVIMMLIIAGVFIWLVTNLFKWKRIWNLTSACIEEQGNNGSKEAIDKLKKRIASSLDIVELRKDVDKNLKSRGFKEKKS